MLENTSTDFGNGLERIDRIDSLQSVIHTHAIAIVGTQSANFEIETEQIPHHKPNTAGLESVPIRSWNLLTVTSVS